MMKYYMSILYKFKMINFIKSLIIPSQMRKYRYMTAFISILIFIVSVYAIALPNKAYIKNNKEEFLSKQGYVAVLNSLSDLPLDSEIINSNYKVEEGILQSDISYDEVKTYSKNLDIIINDEETNVNVSFVFDIKGIVYNKLVEIRDKFIEKFNKYTKEEALYVADLILINSYSVEKSLLTDEWYIAQINEYGSKSSKEINEELSSKTNFDLYNVSVDKENNNDYLVIFLENQVVTQITYYNQDKKTYEYPALTVSYNNIGALDFTNVSTYKDFGKVFTNSMFDYLLSIQHTQYLFTVLLYVVGYPALFSLLLYWCMKKRGAMKRYKEYYNIAAITSILPAIVTFILSWFVPNIVPLYGALFSIYTLVSFMKINSMTDSVD